MAVFQGFLRAARKIVHRAFLYAKTPTLARQGLCPQWQFLIQPWMPSSQITYDLAEKALGHNLTYFGIKLERYLYLLTARRAERTMA